MAALPIRAPARAPGATLKAGETVEYALGEQRHGDLVPASGAVEVNGARESRGSLRQHHDHRGSRRQSICIGIASARVAEMVLRDEPRIWRHAVAANSRRSHRRGSGVAARTLAGQADRAVAVLLLVSRTAYR